MQDYIDSLPELVGNLLLDHAKFTKKNNATAGKRARATALEISKVLFNYRKEVQIERNARKESK